MSRLQAFIVAMLLVLATVAGMWVVSSTNALRAQASKPEVADAQALAKRSKQLDAWEASLARSLRARPPQLPPVPHYAAVPKIHASGRYVPPQLVVPVSEQTAAVAPPRRASTPHVVKPTHVSSQRGATGTPTPTSTTPATPADPGQPGGGDDGGDGSGGDG